MIAGMVGLSAGSTGIPFDNVTALFCVPTKGRGGPRGSRDARGESNRGEEEGRRDGERDGSWAEIQVVVWDVPGACSGGGAAADGLGDGAREFAADPIVDFASLDCFILCVNLDDRRAPEGRDGGARMSEGTTERLVAGAPAWPAPSASSAQWAQLGRSIDSCLVLFRSAWERARGTARGPGAASPQVFYIAVSSAASSGSADSLWRDAVAKRAANVRGSVEHFPAEQKAFVESCCRLLGKALRKFAEGIPGAPSPAAQRLPSPRQEDPGGEESGVWRTLLRRKRALSPLNGEERLVAVDPAPSAAGWSPSNGGTPAASGGPGSATGAGHGHFQLLVDIPASQPSTPFSQAGARSPWGSPLAREPSFARFLPNTLVNGRTSGTSGTPGTPGTPASPSGFSGSQHPSSFTDLATPVSAQSNRAGQAGFLPAGSPIRQGLGAEILAGRRETPLSRKESRKNLKEMRVQQKWEKQEEKARKAEEARKERDAKRAEKAEKKAKGGKKG